MSRITSGRLRIPGSRVAGGSRVALLRDYGIVIAFLALFVVLSLVAPNFFTERNLLNVVDQNAYLAITAFGGTLVIIAGGFDLSVGALFAFVSVFAAYLAIHVDPFVGIAVGIAVGAFSGFVCGFFTTALRVHSFLITLAVSMVLAGLAILVSSGFLIDASGESSFVWLGKHDLIGGIPNSILIAVAVAVILSLVLTRTSYGRYIFAVGGNRDAARLSGVRVGLVVIGTFVISGLCAAIGAIIEVTRTGVGQADAAGASNLPLDAIAVVVIGGTSIQGGQGAIWRTALGVSILALINNGFNLLNVAPQYQQIATGMVIVLAVAANALGGRR